MLELQGRPLVCWVVDKACQVADEVLVAVPDAQVETMARMLPQCQVMAGGCTRQESLDLLAGRARGQWLLEQDGARPFTSVGLFDAVLRAAQTTGCAAAVLDPEVLVATLQDGMLTGIRTRQQSGLTQTPQAYSSEVLEHLNALPSPLHAGQEATVVQRAVLAGFPVRAVTGERTNIKLTTREDWAASEHLRHLLR
jgi:2-C-methyl-D-erythritol 4-phosphate cytidylyltransferase